MSSDFFTEFQKANQDCSLLCFLAFMRKNIPHSLTTQQDRTICFVMKLLFWKFIEEEFFNRTRSYKKDFVLIKLIEEAITEILILHDTVSRTRFESKDSYLKIKTVCLTLAGKLNTHLYRIKNQINETNEYLLPDESQLIFDRADSTTHKYIKIMNTKHVNKEIPNFDTIEYQRNFFTKHNSDYCQICSITDTLNESDYFIFCEVI